MPSRLSLAARVGEGDLLGKIEGAALLGARLPNYRLLQALALGLVGYKQPFDHPMSTSLRFAAVSPCTYRWVVANEECPANS